MNPRYVALMVVAAVAMVVNPLLANDSASTLPSSSATSASLSQPAIKLAQASSSGDAASGSSDAGTSSPEPKPAAAPAPDKPVDLAPAADAPASGPNPLDKWYFQPSIVLWLPSINGTVGARGITSNVDASFIDVLQESDSVIGIGGTLEVGKGKLGGYINGYYARIEVDQDTIFGQTDIVSSIGLMGFGVTYEIGRWRMDHATTASAPARDLTLNLYGGGRQQRRGQARLCGSSYSRTR
jgi:hypothetical protein